MKTNNEWLSCIDTLEFKDKSVLIVGGGIMGENYIHALKKFKIKDITLITKSGNYIKKKCKSLGVNLLIGGYEKYTNLQKFDLVIIATPIPLMLKAAKFFLEMRQKNILIEKPGSLYYQELEEITKYIKNENIRIGYNRLAYPNFFKLKQLIEEDDGITSCRFTFTERISKIDFGKKNSSVYNRWGISNSLHVITMAMELMGMPKEIYPHQYGRLEWHESGSIFVGSGVSEKGIPFSYHADWGSGGRWGIEVNTKKNSYQLIPLEDLFVSPKNEGAWKKVNFDLAFPDLKQGIAEEIAIMLEENSQHKDILLSLEKAIKYNKLAELIFDYH